MDEQNWVDRFNRELDTILRQRSSAMVGFSEEEKRSLNVARRLAHMDWSNQSRLRQSLRRRLMLQARCKAPVKRAISGGRVTSVALFLVLLIVMFGLMSTGMVRPASDDEGASATAYSLHERSIAPTVNAQTFAPTPVSIPLAPKVSSASVLTRSKQQSTPPNLNTIYTPNSSAVVTP